MRVQKDLRTMKMEINKIENKTQRGWKLPKRGQYQESCLWSSSTHVLVICDQTFSCMLDASAWEEECHRFWWTGNTTIQPHFTKLKGSQVSSIWHEIHANYFPIFLHPCLSLTKSNVPVVITFFILPLPIMNIFVWDPQSMCFVCEIDRYYFTGGWAEKMRHKHTNKLLEVIDRSTLTTEELDTVTPLANCLRW